MVPKLLMLFRPNIILSGLVLILLLGGLLRAYQIGSNPPGLTWDEASFGYNAYSILKTGKDEYGNFLPLQLKSFGDYKPAVYTYLSIPFIATLGLTETAVRLPNVILGTLTILMVYLLVNLLFKNKFLALACALMMAISPYAIQFSRPAYEVSTALFFNISAAYFFVRGLKKPQFFILSALFFGLSLFTYQASRLFVPLIVLALVITNIKELKLSKFLVASGVTLAVFMALAGLLIILFHQSNRIAATSYFKYADNRATISLAKQESPNGYSNLGFQILHGDWFYNIRGLGEHYLIYFSPSILFVNGDYDLRHKVPDLGVLYYISAVLIPLGLVLAFKKKESKIILLWLLIAPLPAVLSRDLINFQRAFNLSLPLSVLEGFGLYFLVKYLLTLPKVKSSILLSIVSLVILGNFLIYLDRYFVHGPKELSRGWLYGYKEVMLGLAPEKYQQVIMTDFYKQPYIFYLFYKQYPPEKFQKQAVLDQPTADVGEIKRIDNIEFRHVYFPDDRNLKNTLLIGIEDELPDNDVKGAQGSQLIGQINFLDQTPAFRIVENESSRAGTRSFSSGEKNR